MGLYTSRAKRESQNPHADSTLLRRASGSSESAPEKKELPKCLHCNGRGERMDPHDGSLLECPNCNGTGIDPDVSTEELR